MVQSSDGDVDPYVTLTIQDPQHPVPETQQSSQMHNEPNPHWSQKFDFAMISATSLLVLKVYDKKTTLQNVLHNPVKLLTGKVTGTSPAPASFCKTCLHVDVLALAEFEGALHCMSPSIELQSPGNNSATLPVHD